MRQRKETGDVMAPKLQPFFGARQFGSASGTAESSALL